MERSEHDTQLFESGSQYDVTGHSVQPGAPPTPVDVLMTPPPAPVSTPVDAGVPLDELITPPTPDVAVVLARPHAAARRERGAARADS